MTPTRNDILNVSDPIFLDYEYLYPKIQDKLDPVIVQVIKDWSKTIKTTAVYTSGNAFKVQIVDEVKEITYDNFDITHLQKYQRTIVRRIFNKINNESVTKNLTIKLDQSELPFLKRILYNIRLRFSNPGHGFDCFQLFDGPQSEMEYFNLSNELIAVGGLETIRREGLYPSEIRRYLKSYFGFNPKFITFVTNKNDKINHMASEYLNVCGIPTLTIHLK